MLEISIEDLPADLQAPAREDRNLLDCLAYSSELAFWLAGLPHHQQQRVLQFLKERLEAEERAIRQAE